MAYYLQFHFLVCEELVKLIRLISFFILLAPFTHVVSAAQDSPKYPDFPSETPSHFESSTAGFQYTRQEVMIPMRDGVKLHTVILIPNGAKNAAILLTRTPYNATGLTSHAHSPSLGPILQGYDNAVEVIVEDGYIRVVQRAMPGTPEKAAATYLTLHLVGFLLGRVLTAGTMKFVRAPLMLAVFAAGALIAATGAVASSGATAVWLVVALGFFHSLMFPTIFALSLEGLGTQTKLGASLLVMSIVGGAIIPAVMGRVSDATSIQTAFAVPLVCYAYVLYFGLRGYRGPALEAAPQEQER